MLPWRCIKVVEFERHCYCCAAYILLSGQLFYLFLPFSLVVKKLYYCRYWLWLLIIDYTTTTTYSVFDERKPKNHVQGITKTDLILYNNYMEEYLYFD
jgi:hypothetical protein